MRQVSKFIFYRLLGWKLLGSFPKDLKKYVIIVAPHTSWTDFVLGLFLRSITGVKPYFMAKKGLFKKPFGWFFKSLGGIPINRVSSQNYVNYFVKEFNKRDTYIITLTPEGTRKKVDQWKTGFYYIAKQANVPLVKVAIDYKTREIRIATPYSITNDKEGDFKQFHSYFEGVVGRCF